MIQILRNKWNNIVWLYDKNNLRKNKRPVLKNSQTIKYIVLTEAPPWTSMHDPFFFFSPYRSMHDFTLPHFYPVTALKLIWVISLFQVQINCTIFPLKYFSNCKISVLARAGITKHKLLLNLNQESYDNLHSWKFAHPLHTLEPFHKPPARVWIVLLA